MRIPVDEKLDVLQQSPLTSQKVNSTLGCIGRGVAAGKGWDHPSCSALMRPHPEYRVQAPGTLYRKDEELVEWVQTTPLL